MTVFRPITLPGNFGLRTVLSALWAWFVMTAFQSMPALGVAHAIGISVLVGMLTKDSQTPPDGRELSERLGHSVAVAFLVPALGLLIGWIVKAFLS